MPFSLFHLDESLDCSAGTPATRKSAPALQSADMRKAKDSGAKTFGKGGQKEGHKDPRDRTLSTILVFIHTDENRLKQ